MSVQREREREREGGRERESLREREREETYYPCNMQCACILTASMKHKSICACVYHQEAQARNVLYSTSRSIAQKQPDSFQGNAFTVGVLVQDGVSN